MALSLLYNPVDYSSAHGDLIFTLLEDTKPFNSSLYPDYKYVCDVYIRGFQEARLKSFPMPGNKIGVFNIGNIVRNYFFLQFLPTPNTLLSQRFGENQMYLNVICRFGEEYGGVTYSNIIVDTQRSYFNHYNNRMYGVLTSLPDYVDKAMTNRPYATSINSDATFCFVPFLPSDDTTFNLVIKAYNGSTLVSTTTQPFTPTATSTNELHMFNLAPAAINAAAPGFINSFIEYYTVEFNTTNITGDSVLRFNLKCESIHQVYTLHFLNRFGGFDSKEFSKVSKKTIDIEKSDYGSSAYQIDDDGVPQYFNSSFKVYKEQTSVYATAYEEKMTLNTDLLTDLEYVWLQDLILSPQVYIELNEYFFPIKIVASNYEQKKVVNDDLTNLTISIEFGDRFNTQYR